ncbi:hypothetical protein M407DRAFT_7589 [Tulasnella calospora MUT 4182]|uniref:Uncharacterized protein n=1 Tax=Tulasnella calospora MUT 4182 TaxID=1051891 RepID=A0A0C3QIX6_9AGAM|nr:hypothetical protein M407DRAFT_7589 [Tulasnella calospora MUT 4182]
MSLATHQGQPSASRGQYRLPIEELGDEKKLKTQILWMNTGFDVTYLEAGFTEEIPVPGLRYLIFMAKKVWECADRVHVYSFNREALAEYRQELANICYLLVDNQMTIETNDTFMPELHKTQAERTRVSTMMEQDIENFSKLGFLESAAVRRDPLSGLRENLRTARSSSEMHGIEEQIYNIRMDPTIDASSLPADLSIEVKCNNEWPISKIRAVEAVAEPRRRAPSSTVTTQQHKQGR